MAAKRKIAVFTGSRAEYGFQLPVLRSIFNDSRLEYSLLVAGTHLQEEFGNTLSEIEADGFQIHAKISIEAGDAKKDSPYATAQAIGAGILSVSKVLNELKPDFLLVPADRSEGLAALIAGSQMNLPVAHIEGGDYTEGGTLDDSVRHAMTKMAHLHFTTNAQAAERVRKLGEEDWRIHNVGLPILDLAEEGQFASPDQVEESLQINLKLPIILFCQHSVTTEFDLADEQIMPSLTALEKLAREGYQIIITFPNNDAGGERIIRRIQEFEAKGLPNIQVRKSLGRYLYHGVLNVIGRVGQGCCAGNSSSGIKETPFFGCPSVNIGTRQRGRLRAANVIDAPYDSAAIIAATNRCVEDREFKSAAYQCENIYGSGDAGAQIAEILAKIPIDSRLLQKRMTY